jgi:ankyrin repeat protein
MGNTALVALYLQWAAGAQCYTDDGGVDLTLLARAPLVCCQNMLGNTALHYALYVASQARHKAACVQQLISAGVSAKGPLNSSGQAPLHLFAHPDNSIARELIQNTFKTSEKKMMEMWWPKKIRLAKPRSE